MYTEPYWEAPKSKFVRHVMPDSQGQSHEVRHISRRNLIICAMLVLTLTLPAYAQEVSAGLTGRVTDPSGGAVIGAVVTARDQKRGTSWSDTTNEDGIYAFPRIPSGAYSLKVEAAG